MCSLLEATSTFPCVDAQDFHKPSENINAWCQNLPTGYPLSASPQGSISSGPFTSESPGILSPPGDPSDSMLGPSSSSDECFSIPADPHDVLGQDRYLNLTDETQTQAGSIPSMDFPGSVGAESLSGISRPSPVLSTTPTNFPGTSFTTFAGMPGFATMPQDLHGNVFPTVGSTSYAGHSHLPGCPSARHGSHHHNATHLQHALHHPAGNPMVYNMSSHGWTVQEYPTTVRFGEQQQANSVQSGHSHVAIQPARTDSIDTQKTQGHRQFDQNSHAPSQASSVPLPFHSPVSPTHTDFSQADTHTS